MKLPKLKNLFQVLNYVYKGRKLQVILRETALIVQVILEIANIYVLGKFLDSTATYISTIHVFVLKDYFITDSFYFLALSTGLTLSVIAIDRFRQQMLSNIYHFTLRTFQTDFFDKISQTNLQEVESKEFRDLMALTETYSFTNLWATYTTFWDFIKSLVTGISALILLVNYVNWFAFLIILISLPEPIAGYFNRTKRHRFEEMEVEKTKWNAYVQNIMGRIAYFTEMRVNNTFRTLMKDYNRKSEFLADSRVELQKHFYIDTALFAVIGKLLVVVFVIYSFSISMLLKITIGNLKIIYDYANQVHDSFYSIFESIFLMSNQSEYASSFFNFINYQGFGDLVHGDVALTTKTPKLQFRKLDFKYPKESENTLENLDIEINPGERVMIIGDDGSGKSTLVKILCGLYKVESGDYEVDGNSIRTLKRGELKHRISGVFQDFVNYNMTLQKNITLSSDGTKINNALFEKAIKITGVDKLMKKYDISENQILGKYASKGKDISPGFWQRIAIARMIYRNKGIFILDEPFTYIDNIEEERILKDLFEFVGKEKTVIYITRDSHHAHFFDKIYRLTKGKLIKS